MKYSFLFPVLFENLKFEIMELFFSWKFWLGWVIGFIVWKALLEKPFEQLLKKIFKH